MDGTTCVGFITNVNNLRVIGGLYVIRENRER